MIAMWDAAFARMNPDLSGAGERISDAPRRFELMHAELDLVWGAAFAALKPGGFLIVNIGDATRTVEKSFQLYPNHARVIAACTRIGFNVLPGILWRKPTNAPNKFMGSGMLPAGAYVTLEHEHILVFRKGERRRFTSEAEKLRRRSSAIFWEERNNWFSDIWQNVRGARQSLSGEMPRDRSAAFPFEFAYRLIHMFSLQGDTICDPFLGTGTTTLAAIAGARHSMGMEIEAAFEGNIVGLLRSCVKDLNESTGTRLARHRDFMLERERTGRAPAYWNAAHNCAVVTAQERDLTLLRTLGLVRTSDRLLEYEARHRPYSAVSGVTGESEAEYKTDDRPGQGQACQDAPPAVETIGQD
jgi:hypothetical protein